MTRPTRAAGTWLALAGTESRRVLLHPAYTVSLGAVVAMWVLPLAMSGRTRYAALTNMSWEVQLPYLVVAAGLFLAATLVGLRVHRWQTWDTGRVQGMPAWAQSAAQCAAVVPAALVTGGVAATQLLVQASEPSAVGAIQALEVATVPAFVLFAGCLGVMAGQVTRSLGASLGVLAVLCIVTMSAALSDEAWRWLAPAALENPFRVPPAPSPMVDRPAGWHVLWLLALAGLAVAVALAVRGLRRPIVLASAGTCLAVAVTAAVPQLNASALQASPVWRDAHARPDVYQQCIDDGGDTYCVFPGFEPLVAPWAQMVHEQRAAAPVDQRPITVRQRLGEEPVDGIAYAVPQGWATRDTDAGTPGALSASTRWAAPGEEGFDQVSVLAFALSVAHTLVAGTPLAVPEGGRGAVELCGGQGIATLWLAVGTNDAGLSALTVIEAHGDLVSAAVADSGVDLVPGERELEVVHALLSQPAGEVSARMTERWAELTAADVTVDDAARMLEVPAPPPLGPEFGICAGG